MKTSNVIRMNKQNGKRIGTFIGELAQKYLYAPDSYFLDALCDEMEKQNIRIFFVDTDVQVELEYL